MPSLAYGGLWGNKGHKNGKEGYLVEVYDGFVFVRGMDFATGNFVSSAAFYLPEEYKNDVITYGITVKKMASGAVWWKSRKSGNNWNHLTTLADLKTDGTLQTFDCSDGKTVEFRANETHVQWRCPQDPDSNWADFVAIEDLPKKSPSDAPSTDGTPEVSSDAPSTNGASEVLPDSILWLLLSVGGVLCLGTAGICFFFLKKKR